MSRNWRVGLRGIVAWAGMVCLATGGFATELAAVGAKGSLEMSVTVEGADRIVNQGAGWDHQDWKVEARAELRVAMVAQEPTVNLGALGDVAALDDGREDWEEEDDGDWEAAYDDAYDQCDGDEDCETQVDMQRLQDPRFQAAMGGAMAAMAGGGLDLGDALTPSVQPWAMVGGSVTGTASIAETVTTYGAIDTGGGPKRDETCRTTGEATLASQASGYGEVHPVLMVNGADSTYELRIPADAEVAVTSDCDAAGRSTTWPVLGLGPKGGGSWGEALTVRGELSGSADQPALSGTRTWEGEWQSGRPTRVTIHWKFRP